ncbi:uncharacterized protein LOC125949686 [Anopheles darlingi]|uniref:uncharacterized protein LOC125949686 n=1 Tax=Anopheles darlingi TaxID=43151 RepID=UPI0021005782|nr:uncharacterized protein LOC125949686 [Anopheles darlingi]XP_049532914.1 uncharacterized protein LOC125949686 [Anopheles darlingi]XP_049532915.1 uncharacterized protein LOC125949686 [Anopheles darlingi]
MLSSDRIRTKKDKVSNKYLKKGKIPNKSRFSTQMKDLQMRLEHTVQKLKDSNNEKKALQEEVRRLKEELTCPNCCVNKQAADNWEAKHKEAVVAKEKLKDEYRREFAEYVKSSIPNRTMPLPDFPINDLLKLKQLEEAAATVGFKVKVLQLLAPKLSGTPNHKTVHRAVFRSLFAPDVVNSVVWERNIRGKLLLVKNPNIISLYIYISLELSSSLSKNEIRCFLIVKLCVLCKELKDSVKEKKALPEEVRRLKELSCPNCATHKEAAAYWEAKYKEAVLAKEKVKDDYRREFAEYVKSLQPNRTMHTLPYLPITIDALKQLEKSAAAVDFKVKVLEVLAPQIAGTPNPKTVHRVVFRSLFAPDLVNSVVWERSIRGKLQLVKHPNIVCLYIYINLELSSSLSKNELRCFLIVKLCVLC